MAINHKDITSGLGNLGTREPQMLREHSRQLLLYAYPVLVLFPRLLTARDRTQGYTEDGTLSIQVFLWTECKLGLFKVTFPNSSSTLPLFVSYNPLFQIVSSPSPSLFP